MAIKDAAEVPPVDWDGEAELATGKDQVPEV
jgi:hypothetical protein